MFSLLVLPCGEFSAPLFGDLARNGLLLLTWHRLEFFGAGPVAVPIPALPLLLGVVVFTLLVYCGVRLLVHQMVVRAAAFLVVAHVRDGAAARILGCGRQAVAGHDLSLTSAEMGLQGVPVGPVGVAGKHRLAPLPRLLRFSVALGHPLWFPLFTGLRAPVSGLLAGLPPAGAILVMAPLLLMFSLIAAFGLDRLVLVPGYRPLTTPLLPFLLLTPGAALTLHTRARCCCVRRFAAASPERARSRATRRSGSRSRSSWCSRSIRAVRARLRDLSRHKLSSLPWWSRCNKVR